MILLCLLSWCYYVAGNPLRQDLFIVGPLLSRARRLKLQIMVFLGNRYAVLLGLTTLFIGLILCNIFFSIFLWRPAKRIDVYWSIVNLLIMLKIGTFFYYLTSRLEFKRFKRCEGGHLPTNWYLYTIHSVIIDGLT